MLLRQKQPGNAEDPQIYCPQLRADAIRVSVELLVQLIERQFRIGATPSTFFARHFRRPCSAGYRGFLAVFFFLTFFFFATFASFQKPGVTRKPYLF
jgi:hypothetical protein